MAISARQVPGFVVGVGDILPGSAIGIKGAHFWASQPISWMQNLIAGASILVSWKGDKKQRSRGAQWAFQEASGFVRGVPAFVPPESTQGCRIGKILGMLLHMKILRAGGSSHIGY